MYDHRIPQRSLYWRKFFFFSKRSWLQCRGHYIYANIIILFMTIPSSRRTLMQCIAMYASRSIFCMSSILQEVRQRNRNMGRKQLLHWKPSCSPPLTSNWSYSSLPLLYWIIFVIFSNMAPRQEVETVKGVVWEEERLLTQHIFYWNKILLAFITMQGMISHEMCSQWCLKLTVNQQNWCVSLCPSQIIIFI